MLAHKRIVQKNYLQFLPSQEQGKIEKDYK